VATRVPYRQTFVRLLGFLRPYKWSLIVSIVLAVGSQACAIVIAYLTGTGLEKAINATDHSQLYVIAALVLAVGAARAIFMAGRRLISGRQALGVEYDMRNALYAKLLRLSFGFYDRHQTGQLLSRATVDLQTVRFFLGYGLVFFFQNVITIVGATVISRAAWERIEPALRPALLRESELVGSRLRDRIRSLDGEAIAAMRTRGLQVVTPTPELQQQWRDAAMAIYPKVRGELIPAADFDEVLTLVRERRARGAGR